MTQFEILEQVKKMGTSDQILIVENILEHIRKRLTNADEIAYLAKKEKLKEAAKTLLPDYSAEEELLNYF
jgi:hypothetical protein